MERLEALLAEFIEQRERGEAVGTAEFLARHPEGGAELERALAALERAESLFPEHEAGGAIGAYRILREIGHGGMGRVLEVEREGQRFALKLLHAALETNPRTLERFRREGAALARLDHPGLVRVRDSGIHAGRAFLVMDLADGETLASLVARSPARGPAGSRSRGTCVELPGAGPVHERAARWVAELARAVAAAHAAGVLHRDINPRNVLVRAGGSPLLIDFGLVRSEDFPTLTGSGDLLGTAAYMAPEQARGERADERTDVFGLGTVLYEVLTGSAPRSGGATVALLQQAARRPVPAPRRFNRALPRTLDLVARRALAWRPEWRYPSAAELAEDLERCADGAHPLARPPGLGQRATELALTRGRLLAAGAAATAIGITLLITVIAARAARTSEQLQSAAASAHGRAARGWLLGDRDELAQAAAALAQARPEDPLLALMQTLALDPAERAPEPLGHAAAREFLTADGLHRAGEAQAALDHFRAAEALLPGTPLLLLAEGIAASEAGDALLAQGALERSAGFAADVPRLHVALARAYLASGLFEDAVKASSAAMAVAPADASVRILVARARLAHGELAAAEAALAEAGRLGADPIEVAEVETAIERARPGPARPPDG